MILRDEVIQRSISHGRTFHFPTVRAFLNEYVRLFCIIQNIMCFKNNVINQINSCTCLLRPLIHSQQSTLRWEKVFTHILTTRLQNYE